MKLHTKTLLILLMTGCGTNQAIITPVNCSVELIDNGSIITCPDGSSTIISNGKDGEKGEVGQNGSSTEIVSIKLCPYTDNYPNVFPEYAVCIDNELFGVYWDSKNAWLAKIIPGYYASTSTSAPCTFEVKENCEVINNE